MRDVTCSGCLTMEKEESLNKWLCDIFFLTIYQNGRVERFEDFLCHFKQIVLNPDKQLQQNLNLGLGR